VDVIRKHFETIDSTNTWAKIHAPELNREALTLVTASEQTAGRGRFKRKWESPPRLNIYATFCFFMEKHREDIKNLPQVLSISTCEIVKQLGFAPKLKWPNDVLLSGKKMAGLLCETTPLSDHLCIALGIGLNVNMPLEILQKIDRPATSLYAEDGIQRNVEEVIQHLQKQFLMDLDIFLEEGFHHFLGIYKGFMVHAEGDLIRFHDNRIVWNGTFKNLNEDGSLNLQLETGEFKTFHAGEIL
jgi:BirA family transcriptional regulator, biotin operon repressor / biotin---[acetyl-CoA-carboxylase] ligase